MPFNKVAVIGGRALVMGFKIIGIKDVFIVNREELARTIMDALDKREYDLILVDDAARDVLTSAQLHTLETTTHPIIIFIPTQTILNREESVRDLAKRVLGIDILKDRQWKAQ